MSQKILMTKDYLKFSRDTGENRKLDVKRHKKLVDSMKRYGFLSCFPIVVAPKGNLLIVKDGQHRLTIATQLELPIHYIVDETDFDVAVVNSAAKGWTIRDYAEKFAANGNPHYIEGLEFARTHGLPIGTAFALLAGTTSFGNFSETFLSGEYQVKDREWARAVAELYGPLIQLSPLVRNARFIEACMAVCRVKGFDLERMIRCAGRRRDKLASYSTRDAYLDMMEAIYNYGQKDLFPLKVSAIAVMRSRNAKINHKINSTQRKKASLTA